MGYFGGTYESAQTDERKEFNRMLSFVKKSREKVSYIIVYSVDRFSRSGANAIYIKEQLKQRGILIQAVTQPVDASTPNGSFQQNIQIIFSEYDNQIRRMKCMAGQREALLKGEWIQRPPYGYDIVKKDGRRRLVVNETGKLLRKAFHWKAFEGLSIEDIVRRLSASGLKSLYSQKLSAIFRNPFYCGIISHSALNGNVIEGTHEKLISKELFLKVNNVLQEHRHGYSIMFDNDDVPLKNFLKCGHCGENMPGYIVRKKGLWYYKCRTKGCCNNKSATVLHETFLEALSAMTIPLPVMTVVKEQLKNSYQAITGEQDELSAKIEHQLAEIQQRLDRLEERFIMEEITREMFDKYRSKFLQEKRETELQLAQRSKKVSNLDECIARTVNFCSNLQKMWKVSGYKDKQRMQYLIFPEGISYDKKNNVCRTTRINSIFLQSALLAQNLSNKKTGIPALNISYSGLVGPPGLEPGTT